MHKKVLKRKSAFYGRKEFGNSLESIVEQLLKNKGIHISHLNAELLPQDHLTKLSVLKDSTSMFIKLLPDFICTIPGKFSFFLECKRTIRESKFYSFSKDEFLFQKLLAETFRIRILVVFSDWTGMLTAQWINKINKYESYNGAYAKGSKKEYILIMKNSLPSLNNIFNEIT
jgi:hypothetical protein